MIAEVATGRRLRTEVRPIDPSDLPAPDAGWIFDWRAEFEIREVFKLVAADSPDQPYGLIALERRADHVQVTLLESSPRNVGPAKQFRGVAGNLIAFAARLSFSIGADGCVALDSKNELIRHYQDDYGFERIGRSQRLVLNTKQAAVLIAKFTQ